MTNHRRIRAEVPFDAPRISHAAALVPDINASIRFLTDLLSWGPWSVYELVPPRLDNRVYRGTAGAFGMIGAETHVGGIDFALNQSLAGPSIYTEYLDRRGYGLHHLACMSPNGGQDISQRFASSGVGIAMGGRIDKTIEFIYLDSEPALGVAIEAGSGHAIELRPDRTHDVSPCASPPAAFGEIAIVVRDIKTSLANYETLLGWRPWDVSDEDIVVVSPVDVEMQARQRTARMQVGPVELQLVQPLVGTSPERTTLDTFGEGLCHIACRVDETQRGRMGELLDAYNVDKLATTHGDAIEAWYLESLPRVKLTFNG